MDMGQWVGIVPFFGPGWDGEKEQSDPEESGNEVPEANDNAGEEEYVP